MIHNKLWYSAVQLIILPASYPNTKNSATVGGQKRLRSMEAGRFLRTHIPWRPDLPPSHPTFPSFVRASSGSQVGAASSLSLSLLSFNFTELYALEVEVVSVAKREVTGGLSRRGIGSPIGSLTTTTLFGVCRSTLVESLCYLWSLTAPCRALLSLLMPAGAPLMPFFCIYFALLV